MDKTQVSFDALKHLAKFVEEINLNQNQTVAKHDPEYVHPFAAYLLDKAGRHVETRSGKVLSKSEIDEITLDYTTTRSLTEEAAIRMIRYIYDRSGILNRFSTRTVNKRVVPTRRRMITAENLISNEKAGSEVTANKRIIQHFKTDLLLENFNLQFDLPLQTIVDNMYDRSFESNVMDDVVISLGNDILRLTINGLETGNYASTKSFYDLNRGFVYSLQIANGVNTNSYNNLKLYGDAAKIMTPTKVDATPATGSNWTAANLIALMRKMWKLMPEEYRENLDNKWVMSRMDYDLYVESRSDMSSPSNTFREGVLNTGIAPTFMGHEVIYLPFMYALNEKHKANSDVPGMMLFGDLKEIEIAVSSKEMVRDMVFNARSSQGAVYEYDFHGYMDIQIVTPESFVIAFVGATAETPYLVTPEGAKTGHAGKIADTGGTYALVGVANKTVVPYCDNKNVTIVRSTEDLEDVDTLADAENKTAFAIVEQGKPIEITTTTYMKAYSNDLEPSGTIKITYSAG